MPFEGRSPPQSEIILCGVSNLNYVYFIMACAIIIKYKVLYIRSFLYSYIGTSVIGTCRFVIFIIIIPEI